MTIHVDTREASCLPRATRETTSPTTTLERNRQVTFRYCDEEGRLTEPILGNADGLAVFKSIASSFATA